MTTSALLEHEKFCTPRPGLDEPRTESYSLARYGDDGVTQTGRVHCLRCLECGVTSYDGQQRA